MSAVFLKKHPNFYRKMLMYFGKKVMKNAKSKMHEMQERN